MLQYAVRDSDAIDALSKPIASCSGILSAVLSSTTTAVSAAPSGVRPLELVGKGSGKLIAALAYDLSMVRTLGDGSGVILD